MMDIEKEIKIVVEPDIWESKTQFSNSEQTTKYGKLPVQSLNPSLYKHKKLYYENTVIGLMKASKYDGYVEGRISLEEELTQLKEDKARLIEALQDCKADMECWAQYADDYFQEKHDLKGDIAKYDALLAEMKGA
jgi:hypothetical protein